MASPPVHVAAGHQVIAELSRTGMIWLIVLFVLVLAMWVFAVLPIKFYVPTIPWLE
jgi:hypothetical protein